MKNIDCEYCSEESNIYDLSFSVINGELIYESPFWSGYDDGHPLMSLGEINYCPVCGRDLLGGEKE